MSLTTVRNKIDNWLAARWPWLVSKQETYFGIHGHYFQGFWTHSVILEQTDALDGDTIPDNLAAGPSDQVQRWVDLVQDAFDNLPFPARLKIDVYDGPQGKGWWATLQVLYKGNIYERSKGVGLEDHDEAWHIVEEELVP
jgi:hypothetical protein